jgi:hypothetical protein
MTETTERVIASVSNNKDQCYHMGPTEFPLILQNCGIRSCFQNDIYIVCKYSVQRWYCYCCNTLPLSLTFGAA